MVPYHRRYLSPFIPLPRFPFLKSTYIYIKSLECSRDKPTVLRLLLDAVPPLWKESTSGDFWIKDGRQRRTTMANEKQTPYRSASICYETSMKKRNPGVQLFYQLARDESQKRIANERPIKRENLDRWRRKDSLAWMRVAGGYIQYQSKVSYRVEVSR